MRLEKISVCALPVNWVRRTIIPHGYRKLQALAGDRETKLPMGAVRRRAEFIDINNTIIDYVHSLGLKMWTHNCRGN